MLVFVVGAAAALLLSAPALGAGVLSTELPALSDLNIQQSPAIAVDPDSPMHAAVVADDGGNPPFARTATASTLDWSTGWGSPGLLNHSGSTPFGQADVAWGVDAGGQQIVHAVDVGAVASSLCGSMAGNQPGIFYWSSTDGGTTFAPDPPAPPISNTPTNLAEAIEPAIAVDRSRPDRVYVAYARLEFAQGGCQGPVVTSRIWLTYEDGSTFLPPRAVTAFAPGALYRSPSLAVLPDGRVIVAFRHDAASGSQIETTVCDVSIPLNGHYCGGAGGTSIGPTTVLGDATAPAVVSGLVGSPTPSAVAAGGRVTVAWHASVPGGSVKAFAAMSTDGGATFGPAAQIDPIGTANQVAPRLAATLAGRVDVAYLWDPASTGAVGATTASAAQPLAGATTEAWSNPVVVQSAAASATNAIQGQPPLGRGLGIATSSVATALSPLPATVVAFTDTTANPNQDVHVVALLHGMTAPVIGAQTVQASKNTTTIVQVQATDADGDPLSWSTGAQPTTDGSSVSTADAARGQFAFHAANKVGTDTFEAIATDGVPGHDAHAMINVNVVNDPPQIICPSLIATEDTPLVIPVGACVTDPNGDLITVNLDGATGGKVEQVAGQWRFVPALHSLANGSFMLHASDGDLTADARVLVTIVAPTGKVTLDVTKAKQRRELMTGQAVRLEGHAVSAQSHEIPIIWDFGDHTPVARGSHVAHRYKRAGAFTVKASAGGTTVTVKVLVRRRAVELVGAPHVAADGVLTVQVRTRVPGNLVLRADSRSQTLKVPAAVTLQTLRIQVTTGPLVRLTLRLKPSKNPGKLPALSVRRLVLVSPLSAG